MLVVLNDIAFNFKFPDKYKAINCMKQLIEVVAELRKANLGFKVSACHRLAESELTEGYSMSKLFSESEALFPKNYKSALRTFLLNPNIIEDNPKHKVNGGWGSEMDLSDEDAQRVLNEAIVAIDDPKHLIAKYNGNYYSFRLHWDVYYHGYRDDTMPQNLKNKLENLCSIHLTF